MIAVPIDVIGLKIELQYECQICTITNLNV